jgi:hypothetical protein
VLSELALVPSRRAVRRWDVAVVLVAMVFAALGVLAGRQIWELAELNRGLVQAGEALDTAAKAIGMLGGVPLIGDDVGALAAGVRETADEVRASAETGRADVQMLAVVLAVTVFLLGVVPLLLLYLPLRVARVRELRGLRRKLAGRPDAVLIEHLARAALRRVPLPELRRVADRPWADVDQGRHMPLAAAELRRLGVRPPREWTAPGAESAGPGRGRPALERRPR